MKIARRKILLFVFYLAVFALACCSCVKMYEQEGEGGSFGNYAMLASFFLWCMPVLKIFKKGYLLEFPSRSMLVWITFFVWGSIANLAMGLSKVATITEFITNQLYILNPLLIGVVTYYYVRHNGLSKTLTNLFYGMVIMFILTYFSFYDTDNILLNIHLGSSYYSLYALPLVMLFPSKTLRILGLLLVVIAVFSSAKRGGVMALLISGISYILVKQIVSPKSKTRRLLIAIFLLLIFAGMVIYIGTIGDNNVFERFEDIEKDNGSGRTEVWEETWRLINSQDIIHYLLGNGYNTVVADSRLVLSAHNDFLEVWYDYGVIGVLLYSSCILTLIAGMISATKNKARFAAEYAMTVSIVIILTSISHVQLYFWMSIVMLDIAVFMGMTDYEGVKTVHG